ncbi:hypothetical protein GCM10023193_38150 [Planotetraspora kaengkrachanensis]|uniref:Uncharacterized protein n=1 Tax=Planotetraspora kaengkrachanensis TaxID=575193 RepID=A0A8J3PT48_9ACTN|nr:hypothetical protein Pka01_23380 [Planotetraspora kaengkrachanensis]
MQVIQREEHRFLSHPLLQRSLQLFHQQQSLIGRTAEVHVTARGRRAARFPERRCQRGQWYQLGQFVRLAPGDSQPRPRGRGGGYAEQATLSDARPAFNQ